MYIFEAVITEIADHQQAGGNRQAHGWIHHAGTGDIVIDASNSAYTDSIANCGLMGQNGISYLDVGCAGGPDDLLKE